MREIELTQGIIALVDDEDFEELRRHKWHAIKKGKFWYAVRNVGRKRIFMHREILDAQPGQFCDHINHDGLDNRRVNLRLCTRAENQWNSRSRPGTSHYKGVSFYRKTDKWRAQVMMAGETYHLGLFEKEEDAACSYDAAAREIFGQFACVNFPIGQEQAAIKA